jgi:hypothetical protein
VPRWLSILGLLGAPSALSYGVLGILGHGTDLGSPLMLLAMPIALQELVFAGWLIARGFDRPTVDRSHTPEPRVTTWDSIARGRRG